MNRGHALSKNPIYIDYYSHEKCDCYKIDLPWSGYAKDTLVLCHVSEGYGKARKLAIGAIAERLMEVTAKPVKPEVEEDEVCT